MYLDHCRTAVIRGAVNLCYESMADAIDVMQYVRSGGNVANIWSLLELAKTVGASDLHLSCGLPPALRVDGEVRHCALPNLGEEEMASVLAEVMTAEQRTEFASTLESDFSINSINGLRYRVNAFLQYRGTSVVFRTIMPDIQTLDELHCPSVLKQIASKAAGLVLVTGPTGSGKSTTLAAIIAYINDNYPYHILTIEDPIEFVHPSRKSLINQREVHRHTLGFANALRSGLREDPDCILVGELRDLETIRLALSAAETGHLVLATLHTNSAPKTLDRLIDVFPAEEKALVRAMVSESLSAVVSQVLIKKVGGGRIAAWEVMVCTSGIRNLIREGKTAQMYSAMQTGQAQGMMTLDQSIQDLLRKQLITEEDCHVMAR